MRFSCTKLLFATIALALLGQLAIHTQFAQEKPLDLDFYLPPTKHEQLPLSNKTRALNVVLMIGDGMGQAQIDAARITAMGASGFLHLERMPVTGLVHTHSADRLITDSAASGTALSTGFKTNYEMVGQLPDGTRLTTILEAARDEGLATGLVVTSAINHATPASFTAHNVNRYNYAPIAVQMLEAGVDVMLGGGRQWFLPKGVAGSARTDELDLVAQAKAAGYDYLQTEGELRQSKADRLLGLFASDELLGKASEPTLAEMTGKALSVLDKNNKGFFLLVEGSLIDWEAHDHKTPEMIQHLLQFDMAVKKALDFAIKDKNTLVVVTADHETGGMTIFNGGLDGSKLRVRWTTIDHTPLTVPLFAFGPGANSFMGVYDNTKLPRLMSRALNLKTFLPDEKDASAKRIKLRLLFEAKIGR